MDALYRRGEFDAIGFATSAKGAFGGVNLPKARGIFCLGFSYRKSKKRQ
jgi:hypothetical protein